MKIVKLDVDPQYYVEDFGVVSIDEECSWWPDDQHFAVCEIVRMDNPIREESTTVFYYDRIAKIEKELRLMPGSLGHALFMYMLDNKVVFEHTDI